jgi:predicted Fe-Mo cluster-binding NifX family protein
MKIAVTAQGTTLDAQVDPRFGRAAYILVVDTETRSFRVLDNATNVNAFKGAGIQAATMVADSGAEVLLTGYCGPKAFQTIQAAGVKVVNDIEGTINQAIDRFNSGDVTYADGANADAHW